MSIITKFKKLDSVNIDKIINESWCALKNKIENGHLLSSEKTMCFLFAIEIFERCSSKLFVDFEYQCYEGIEGKSKYLDLLLYTDEDFKIAIEFKLPRKSKNGNSNQLSNRKSIYRDLARLQYLKENNIEIKSCYF